MKGGKLSEVGALLRGSDHYLTLFVTHSDSFNHRCFRPLNASILADKEAFSIIFEVGVEEGVGHVT